MARKTTAPLADGETLDEAGPNDPLAAGAPSTPAELPAGLPGAQPRDAGPSPGELEEAIQDRNAEIEQLKAQLIEQAAALASAQRAAAEATVAAQRAIAAASKKFEIATERQLGPDDPAPPFDPLRPAGAIYGPAGHIGYEQMRGGRTFRYRKNHDPWPEGQE